MSSLLPSLNRCTADLRALASEIPNRHVFARDLLITQQTCDLLIPTHLPCVRHVAQAPTRSGS